jgi:small-conductance mechanosensitive channel
VLAGLAVMASFAMLVDWPAPTKPLVLIFLLLLLLAWIIALALTAVLRCGARACPASLWLSTTQQEVDLAGIALLMRPDTAQSMLCGCVFAGAIGRAVA